MKLGYRIRILIACPDRPGIIAAVSEALYHLRGNIVTVDQHSEDPDQGMFFMRIEVALPGSLSESEVTHSLAPLASKFSMELKICRSDAPRKMAVFVSREDHCLKEVAWQCESGEIGAKIALVISNHPDLGAWAASAQLPFYHIPVTPDTKGKAELQARALLHDIDLIVLARYMQILSPQFVESWAGRMINIHHSFLPAFVGPNPYRQAFERGVKLIGATAHYVTADLDQGPIIEQDVQRVDHRQRVPDLKRLGRHVERMVLTRAVRWHTEDRVLIYQNRTVVFP